jgi:hypothetical protein
MIQHASTDEELQPVFVVPPRALGVGRLGIAEELLADLDSATYGGRGYTMGKIWGLLRDEAADSDARLSELQRRAVKRALDDLAREQSRLLPDQGAFVNRAHDIARTLSLH